MHILFLILSFFYYVNSIEFYTNKPLKKLPIYLQKRSITEILKNPRAQSIIPKTTIKTISQLGNGSILSFIFLYIYIIFLFRIYIKLYIKIVNYLIILEGITYNNLLLKTLECSF